MIFALVRLLLLTSFSLRFAWPIVKPGCVQSALTCPCTQPFPDRNAAPVRSRALGAGSNQDYKAQKVEIKKG